MRVLDGYSSNYIKIMRVNSEAESTVKWIKAVEFNTTMNVKLNENNKLEVDPLNSRFNFVRCISAGDCEEDAFKLVYMYYPSFQMKSSFNKKNY